MFKPLIFSWLIVPKLPVYNKSARTAQKTPFPVVPQLLRVDSLQWEHILWNAK
jgi:hypothetical protein